jgi:hypothetical protein
MKPNFKTKVGLVFGAEVAAEILAMSSGLNGDLVCRITPTAKTKAATAAAWTETITVELVDSEGRVHSWFNKTLTTRASVGDTSSAGTATIGSTSLVFVNGVATVALAGGAAAWLAADTVTVTIATLTVNGVSVTGGTAVITFA